MEEDIDIIKSVSAGDKNAFRLLYDLYSERVYNTALSYIKAEEQAEEITQDVFVSIYKNAHQFKGNSKLSTWIYRITINKSLNQIKKKKRVDMFNQSIEHVDKSDFNHPGVLLENKELAKQLFTVIDNLPDSQKTAFIMSYIEDLPRQEVADIMGLSLKAVESLLQRAKKNLRSNLESLYPNRRKNK